ncbi:MAG: MarR family transcriptional regulator [Oscillospiraceae bacterium]|nr:MarR family transcriptional regulator [Oscillospiraceae bacterium]
MGRNCCASPEHFGPLLGYCDHQVQKLMGRLLRQYDVTPMQCRTLTYLYRQGGESSQKQLEQHLMVKPSTVNGIVDRLEEKGMLCRSADKQDGRRRVLTLTEQGVAFHGDFLQVIAQVNRRLEQGFTQEELAAFRGFLLRTADNLREEEQE